MLDGCSGFRHCEESREFRWNWRGEVKDGGKWWWGEFIYVGTVKGVNGMIAVL